MQKTKIYKSWQHLKERCDNKNCKSYKDYGARGITYNVKWKNFIGFYEDMGDSYIEGLTIDRIDVNGNYNKENCRWIPKGEQNRNTRANVMYKGKCLTEWCEILKLNRSTIYSRLNYGWTIKRALGLD